MKSKFKAAHQILAQQTKKLEKRAQLHIFTKNLMKIEFKPANYISAL